MNIFIRIRYARIGICAQSVLRYVNTFSTEKSQLNKCILIESMLMLVKPNIKFAFIMLVLK